MTTITPLFTWIHLSDIHDGHGDAKHAEDQKLVLNELKNDISRAAALDLPSPNAIFVTGDLAFSGSARDKDEYKRVGTWLREIATKVSLSVDRVFVVPGNHDVERNVEENDPAVASMLKELRSGELKVDNILADKEKRTLLGRRFSNYLEFAKEFAPASCFPEPRRADLFWSHKLKITADVTLLLVGMNTALLAAKEEDEYNDFRRLESGTAQLAHAFSSTMDESPKELRIVLSHHPFNWLRDGAEVRAVARKYAHIHLCGHVHDPESSRELSGSGQQIITVTAGAVHEEAREDPTTYRHGYNFASIWQRNDRQLMLRVWPRVWSKNFEFRVDQNSIPAMDAKGKQYREAYVDHELQLSLSAPNVTRSLDDATPNQSSESLADIKCKSLIEQRNLLIEQYKAVGAKMIYALDPADKVIMTKQLEAIEKKLAEVEAEIQKLC
jgi:predicted MPP superfamily phosphohydrolase